MHNHRGAMQWTKREWCNTAGPILESRSAEQKQRRQIDSAAAGMKDILAIWLNGPASNDQRLTGE
jgi:hypothetical protein